MNLLKLVTGGVFDKVLDKVLPDKVSQEDKLKLTQAFELELMANETKIEEYRRDMIKADSESDDPYVSRARPTLFYIMYVVIVFNYMVIPTVQALKGVALNPIVLPPELWNMFTVAFLGYAGLRTYEKHSKNKHKKLTQQ